MTYNVCNLKESRPFDASLVPAVMDKAGVEFAEIGAVCWPDSYPYRPEVKFRMAHCGDALLLHFQVEEQCMRSTCRHDNESVWNDSCVEFFFSPEADGTYYNMECNCTGALLIGYGQPKRFGERKRGGEETTAKIDRWASLGREPIGERSDIKQWEVALIVPASAFFAHNIASFDGMEATANFYKCGDALPVPHYLAWHKVETEKPDFHRPEYFGKLRFC